MEDIIRRDKIRRIDVRTISKNAQVAIAFGKYIGELEARQRDNPHRIEKGEWPGSVTHDDGEGLGDPFKEAAAAIGLTSFRDASEDRREDVEEHDDNGKPSVDGVSQGTTPQTDRRGEEDDDHGCTGCSELEKKA